jgi:hypothetical protein
VAKSCWEVRVNRYQKGRRLEKKSQDWLTGQGYAVPMTSRGSKGLFDLVAINQRPTGGASVHLVQVKANRMPTKHEMALLADFWTPVGVVKAVHVWRDRVSTPEFHIL